MTTDQLVLDEGTGDYRDPALRLSRLLDVNSAVPLHESDDCGVLAMKGRISGVDVRAYSTDARVMGGSMTARGCRRIVDTIDTAVRERSPVIGLWHSGGARLAEGADALDGVGRVFAAMIRSSGKVPQISVVLGPAAGGAAYGAALTDVVIMSDEGRVFVTGPDVVRSVTGEDVDMTGLGGPDTHARRSGVVHVVADSEADAIHQARRTTLLLAERGVFHPNRCEAGPDLRGLLPDSARRAYDVRPLVRAILDPDSFLELQARWAPNLVVGFGRLCGGTIGVIANNPLRKAGCLDSLSAEKAARFVRMCDAFGVPMLVLVDVPGYLPGVGQEWDGVVRRGAKLLYAFGESVVPRITLITRKSYGGAYIAMNSRALGATRVFAWPEAEIAVMGAEAAVGILHRRSLAAAADDADRAALLARLVEEHERGSGGVIRALDIGVVDEVIVPADSRRRLAEAFAAAAAVRGSHGNIPL
ncbi:carboxyl transferase domain-containing protein [Actinomadura sp. DC4]|uniref:acyl-CoA carboxylase subunit beta n=1 Tax=Actinomadura sp. DC4 TaxID=3055069 RepID=UPI00339D90A4